MKICYSRRFWYVDRSYAGDILSKELQKMYSPGVSKQTTKPSNYASGQQAFYERECLIGEHKVYYVSDCPFARRQEVPVHSSAVASTSSSSGYQVKYKYNNVCVSTSMIMSLMRIHLFLKNIDQKIVYNFEKTCYLLMCLWKIQYTQ